MSASGREEGQRESTVIDSLEFARQQSRMAGQIQIARFERLSDVLFDRCGELSFTLAGEWQEEGKGKGFLNLQLDGDLLLKCQRCLEELAYPIHLSRTLALVVSQGEWDDEALEEEGYDEIPAEKELDLAGLLEDEILLALPVAPSHADCTVPRFAGNDSNVLPFAALAKLKRN